MLKIEFIPEREFKRVKEAKADRFKKLAVLSDMCRLNALSSVKKAGSGHLGSSFSAMDILTLLYLDEMNTVKSGIDNPERDVFFSSKGHDCPGQYAVFAAAGILDFEKLLKLRRIGGLDGHPDVKIPGIEANSGSLGMGVSKAKGMALAKKLSGHGGRVFVLTGDGELQEGQIWESLQTAVYQKINNLTMIVDFNKIQTDRPVKKIIDLGEIEKKLRVFGWHVERCDGHGMKKLSATFKKLKKIKNKPKALIADTIKGRGVSFMEGPSALKAGKGLYRWHSGAPDDESYEKGVFELTKKINLFFKAGGLSPLVTEVVEQREKNRAKLKDTVEKVVTAFGEALAEIGAKRKDVVVFDADLSADCGLRPFETKFPGRFIESGIAEQDMVSTAGGLALNGYLPVVNSFGVFLSSRANEQIYANATELTKIIYVCHYAGLIPAGPGKSHQSLRDVSLFGALPNCTILEPCNAVETKQALEWCVNKAKETCMMRLAISPSPRTILLPEGYDFSFGKGTVLKQGSGAIIFAYGPVMLNEALIAAEILEGKGFSLKVVNMPWLNRVDDTWLEEVIGDTPKIFALDNHSPYGGLGDSLLNALNSTGTLQGRRLEKFGVEGYPACGTPGETLKYHGLDGESLAKTFLGAE
ncbi:MAG TPA: transketolase C-terminal domain-containing protein [Thermodesulfobacteriota bacterium]|nr:transketolase C-terminal domain-containing protein [Thermodesulfobacteriota bacterium]